MYANLHRIRGKLTLRKKEIRVLIKSEYKDNIFYFCSYKKSSGMFKCLFLLFCFPLFPLSELYFFVDFDDFSHVHAVVVIAVTAAVVFHVDFLVGVVVLRQFVGVDFFADEDEIRFFYGGGTV